jgi:hypothetical protein
MQCICNAKPSACKAVGRSTNTNPSPPRSVSMGAGKPGRSALVGCAFGPTGPVRVWSPRARWCCLLGPGPGPGPVPLFRRARDGKSQEPSCPLTPMLAGRFRGCLGFLRSVGTAIVEVAGRLLERAPCGPATPRDRALRARF